MPLVGVIMGSKSDEPYVKETTAVLERLGIEYEVNVISAHRTPEKAREYGKTARDRGLEVLIAADVAGRRPHALIVAHLAEGYAVGIKVDELSQRFEKP